MGVVWHPEDASCSEDYLGEGREKMLPLSTALWLVIPPVAILAIVVLYYFRGEGPS